MRRVRACAGAIAVLTAGVLITFYAVKDTRPSGAAVMTILWVVFALSLIWAAFQDACIGRLKRWGFQVPIGWRGWRSRTDAPTTPESGRVVIENYTVYSAETMHFNRPENDPADD
jgi:hypothetical protein